MIIITIIIITIIIITIIIIIYHYNHIIINNIIIGLADDLDVKKIARALKKTFQCNGSVLMDAELGEILQLSGDQRTNVRDFFIDQEVCHEDQIVIHGG